MQVKKDDVKERILKSAKYEFNKYGYIRASMVRLASRAKMSVGNVYKYFKNKEALLDGVLSEVYVEMPAGFKRLEASDAQIADFVEYIVGLYEKYPAEIQIIMQKAQGSKYAGFKNCVIGIAAEEILSVAGAEENSRGTIRAIASGAVECILSILVNEKSKRERRAQLTIAMNFYFHNLRGRLIEQA